MEDETNNTEDIDEDTFEKLSKTEGIPKFIQMCRVCLCKTNESDPQLNTRILFLNDSLKMGNLLEESTGVQIINLECLPNHICDKCLKTLTAWYRFRSRTQRSNGILKNYLKHLNTSMDSKSLSSNNLTIHIQGDNLNVVPKQNVSKIQSSQKDTPKVVGFVLHCNSCTMTFSNQIDLDKHQEEHINLTQKKFFKCLRCPKSFVFRNGLHSHMQLSHHQSNRYKYQCEVCERNFNSSARFKVHKRKPCVPVDTDISGIVDVVDIQIDNNIEIGSEDDLNIGTQDVSKNELNNMETDIPNCQDHIQEKDSEEITPNQPENEMSSQIEIDFSQNEIDSIPQIQLLEAGTPVHSNYQLDTDSNLSNANTVAVSVEEENAADETSDDTSNLPKSTDDDQISATQSAKHIQKLFDKCRVNCHVAGCQTTFSNLNQIWDHFKKTHLTGDKPYKCISCSKILQNQKSLCFHIKKHYHRTHECTKCGKKLSRLCALKSHEKTHKNTEEFVCNICSKDFFSQNGLNLHLKSHEDIRELQCPICSRQFRSTDRLKQHIDMNTCVPNEKQINLSLDAMEDENKDHEEVDENDLEDVPESIKNSKDMESFSNAVAENELTDIPTNQESTYPIAYRELQSDDNNEFNTEVSRVNCHVAGCQTTFSNLNEIWDHFKKTHLTGDKPYKCCSCSKILQNQKSLCFHIKKHYHRTHECTKCGKKLSRLCALKSHEKTHKNTEEFVCNICSKDFFSQNGLNLHLKSHEDIRELQCPICSRQFRSTDRLKQHIDMNTCVPNEKQINLSLDAMEDENKDHEEVDENDLEDVPESIKNSKDMEIDDESFSNAVAENELTNIPTNQESTYPIAYCELQSDDNNEFNTEVSRVNCHVAGCQTTFSNLNEIWDHFKKTHLTGDKPYKCCSCSKILQNQKSLCFHIKKHYHRTHECAKCGKKLSRLCALKSHEKTHKNTEEFVCNICSKDFFSQNELNLHLKSHEDIRELQCPICSRQFRSTDRLKQHIDMNTCVPNEKQINLSLDAMEDENKDHEEVDENDLEDVPESIKNSKDMEIDDESFSNAVAENELTDIPTNQESTYPIAYCELQSDDNNEFNTEVSRVNCHVAGCQTTFSNLNEIWDHFKKTHLTGDKPYKCCSCSKILQHQQSLHFHIKKHYHQTYECSKCGKKLSRLCALKSHEKTHKNTEEFVCNICSKDFFSQNELNLHLKSHEDIRELQCPICSRQFRSTDRLKQHIDINTCVPNGKQINLSLEAMEDENKDHEEVDENDLEGVPELIKNSKDMEIDDESYLNSVAENELTDISTDQETTYPIAYCELQIVDNNELNTEVKKEIIVPEDIVRFENPFFYNFSSEDENGDETDNYHTINEEMSKNESAQSAQELLDKCKLNCHIAGCQTKSANLTEVWQHFKKKHVFGSLPFTCCMCSEKFESVNSLRLHIKKYYTFKCPVCNKLTTNSGQLRIHVKLAHTNEPPFKCEKCGKKFGKNSNLKAHETIHNETKDFVCNICPKAFYSNSVLKQHKNSHKDIKELQCSTCSKQFLSKSHLKRHINTNICGQIKKL